MNNRVIAATFDDQDAAFEAAQDAQDLDRRGVIKIKRGAILARDVDGTLTIPDAKDLRGPWGLLGGGVIGALLGLLFGPAGAGAAGALSGAAAGLTAGAAGEALSDGVQDDRENQLIHDAIAGIEAGQTVLLAELDEGSTEPLDTAITRRGGRLFRTEGKPAGKLEQLRQRVRSDLAARRARIEHDIEANEEQMAWENDALKENDIKVFDLMTAGQRSRYDVYANSQGPSSTRPVDE
jgi:uncharacterized membrane protein